MKKLYAKSELLFSIFWIVLYVAGTSLVQGIGELYGHKDVFVFVFHLALAAFLLVWIIKNKLTKRFGLCRTDIRARHFLYYIPFCLLVGVNLFAGFDLTKPTAELVFGVGSMLCVGFLEEIIFRGFLFTAMAKDSLKAAAIVSSVTFGIGHILNLLNGAEILPTVCQILYATAFGFLCVVVFYKGKTLLPCIIAHSAVNALSVFTKEPVSTVQIILPALVLFVVAACYAIYLWKKLPEKGREI
ncbi:MAG: CPBP family intramembrane metalloprotease [Ruminococcaceae bacterium]|nr:CPBP family intramembrane metalloprotease [Oscillospiraceae bacterium]